MSRTSVLVPRRALLTLQQSWPPSLAARAIPLPFACTCPLPVSMFSIFVPTEQHTALQCCFPCRQTAKIASYFLINKCAAEWSDPFGPFPSDGAIVHPINGRIKHLSSSSGVTSPLPTCPALKSPPQSSPSASQFPSPGGQLCF